MNWFSQLLTRVALSLIAGAMIVAAVLLVHAVWAILPYPPYSQWLAVVAVIVIAWWLFMGTGWVTNSLYISGKKKHLDLQAYHPPLVELTHHKNK
jgi:cytochrome c biogenesis protein CcdA